MLKIYQCVAFGTEAINNTQFPVIGRYEAIWWRNTSTNKRLND